MGIYCRFLMGNHPDARGLRRSYLALYRRHAVNTYSAVRIVSTIRLGEGAVT